MNETRIIHRAEKRARETALQDASCNITVNGKASLLTKFVYSDRQLPARSSQSYGPSRTYSQCGSLSFRPKGSSSFVLRVTYH